MTRFDAPYSLDALVEQARMGGPVRVAVADAAQPVVLETMREALRLGLAEPCLIGVHDEIAAIMETLGWPPEEALIIPSAPDADAAAKAVAMVRRGEAAIVMKGNLHTDTFMRALLDVDDGLRLPDRRVSHLFLMQLRNHERMIGVTDAAINISPDLSAKAQICQNAVDAFRSLGINKPRVAAISAVETVTGAIGSTLDAAALTLMARRGQIADALVDGPLALDNAISSRAAAEKGMESQVAGRADILLVLDLVAGNVLVKALEYLGGAEAAGVALGLSAPAVLTSRADTRTARLASIALAALLWRSGDTQPAALMAEPDHRTLRPAPQADASCCPLSAAKSRAA